VCLQPGSASFVGVELDYKGLDRLSSEDATCESPRARLSRCKRCPFVRFFAHLRATLLACAGWCEDDLTYLPLLAKSLTAALLESKLKGAPCSCGARECASDRFMPAAIFADASCRCMLALLLSWMLVVMRDVLVSDDLTVESRTSGLNKMVRYRKRPGSKIVKVLSAFCSRITCCFLPASRAAFCPVSSTCSLSPFFLSDDDGTEAAAQRNCRPDWCESPCTHSAGS
jgi:hypothetical protein